MVIEISAVGMPYHTFGLTGPRKQQYCMYIPGNGRNSQPFVLLGVAMRRQTSIFHTVHSMNERNHFLVMTVFGLV